MFKLCYYYFYFIGYLIICVVVNAQFYFSKAKSPEQNPSYLFKEFPNVTESRFPSKLEITFSMPLFEGMLYASLDQFVNSLLLEIVNKKIRIYYNLERKEIPLDIFCKCRRKCLYEKIIVEVVIKDKVIFKCNNGQQYELKIDKSNKRRLVKPYILFPKTNVPNQAILYIVNHRQYPFHRPYSNQLVGCIFEVKYNNKVIKMDKEGRDVEEGCPRRCIGSGSKKFCNDGQCIETYSKYNVLCDCTRSIYNGPRCNEGLSKDRLNGSMKLQHSNLKVSWKSGDIVFLKINKIGPTEQFTTFMMERKTSQIGLHFMNINSNGHEHETTILLRENTAIQYYSVILSIDENLIRLEVPQINFVKSILNRFILLSKYEMNIEFSGIIALGYKTNNSFQWENYNSSFTFINKPNMSNSNKKIYYEIILLLSIVICIIFLIITILAIRKSSKIQKKSFHDRTFLLHDEEIQLYENNRDYEGIVMGIATQTIEEEEKILVEIATQTKEEDENLIINETYSENEEPNLLVQEGLTEIIENATCKINTIKIEIKEYFYEKDSDTKFISTNLPIRAKDLKNKMNNVPNKIILISEDKEVKDEYNINEEINNLKYILVKEFKVSDKTILFHCTIKRQIFTFENEDKCLFIKQYLDVPVENILQEVKILKKLQNHDNIVKVESLQKSKSNFVLAIEYHTKGTLKEHLMKKGISEREELLVNKFLGQLLDVVRYIHSQGFVHGDFVCDNILISNDTNLVKLVGFDNAECLKTQENEDCSKDAMNFRESNITNEKYDIKCLGVCIKEMIGESDLHVSRNEFLKAVIADCIQEDQQAIPSADELIERFIKIIKT